jgi:hypothetical protein
VLTARSLMPHSAASPFAAVCAAILLTSCAQMQAEREAAVARLNALVGQHADEAIKALGPPTASASLSNGGAVLEWRKTEQRSGGGSSYTTYRSTIVNGQVVSIPQQQHSPMWSRTVECRLLMTVAASQHVESWRREGNGC